MLILYALLGGLFNAAAVGALLLVPAGLVPGGTWCWPPGPALAVVGAALAATGVLVMFGALFQNEFAAPNVQDQRAQQQRVVDTGLYAVVRHPMYAGAVLLFPGIALWLQSTAALAACPVLVAVLLARIAVEERYLRANLAGYADYAARVRARLVPFVL